MRMAFGANECCEKGDYEVVETPPMNNAFREVKVYVTCSLHLPEAMNGRASDLNRIDVFEAGSIEIRLTREASIHKEEKREEARQRAQAPVGATRLF